ncbi:MAG TPA: glycosyltransferase family 39 protein [Gaiellaceae bacterium]
MTSTQHEAAWPAARRTGGSGHTAALERLRPHAPLAGLLVVTALLYFWGLTRLGYANDFYAAAVKSGTQSWKAFLFGSLDSSNYITVDKPPAALWVMELSGRLFGFSSFSLLMPQALEGVAAVALLYATVRRWFSAPAALLSGLILALTPVAALMFRFDNPDALLVLLLVVAGYAVTRALERASTAWLALAGGAIGLAFLTKMMQAFLVLPAFVLVYLVAAPTPLRRRVWQVLTAGLALVAAGGWWVALVVLWPAGSRPYIGGSTNNSVLDLIWGYNGLGRIEGGTTGGGGGANFSGLPGILRLFNAQLGGQISWLVPAALVVIGSGLVWTWRRPSSDRTRGALLLWGGWFVVSALVYSYMSGGMHQYYTNTLAPSIAVLVGVGMVELWRFREQLVARILLGSTVTATAAWSYRLLDRTPTWHSELRVVILVGGLAAAAALLAAPTLRGRLAVAIAAVALFAGLAGPTAYTLSTISTAATGSTVSAGPGVQGAGGFGRGAGLGGPGGSGATSSALAQLLKASPSTYTWAAATSSSMTAAPLELATGKAVMAIGGFTGGDNAITLARFKQLVAAGKVHYYVAGGGVGGGGFGGRGGSDEIGTWVASAFTASTMGGTTVYDLSS